MDKLSAWARESIGVVSQMWERGEYAQGRKLLQSILNEEPDYAVAHAMAGWYAQYQEKNRAMARKHYEWAIKFDPSLQRTYYDFAELLIEEKDLNRLEQLKNEGLKHDTVDKANLLNDYGRMLEILGKHKEAARVYKAAIKYTMNSWLLDTIKDNRKRARSKYRLFDAVYARLM